MITKIPISFDSTVQIIYSDGSAEISKTFPTKKGLTPCSFSKVNGYDSNNNRVTNLVGFDGHELLKKCPNCSKEKRVTAFGYLGRVTNEKRDQSNCTDCRSLYQQNELSLPRESSFTSLYKSWIVNTQLDNFYKVMLFILLWAQIA